MTALARKVLGDCHIALRLLEDEAQVEVWPVHFAGAMALIRIVNDVLKRENKKSLVGRIYRERFKAWSDKLIVEHSIFREFITDERNLLLHEYRTNVDLRNEVSIFVSDGRPGYAPPDETDSLPVIAEDFKTDQNIFRPMMSGIWSNEDVRDVYRSALDWWKEQLDSIDKEVELGQVAKIAGSVISTT